MKKMTKRMWAMLLALAVALTTLFAGGLTVLAGTPEVTTATVNFTSQLSGAFLHAPMFDYEVPSDKAESYGYTDAVEDGVSALDVLVAAHELVFEDDFTNETANNFLVIENNNVEKQFGIDPEEGWMVDTFRGGFYVNHTYPVDTSKEDPAGGYEGTTVGTQRVNDGDLVEFFFYENEYQGDSYNWFLDEDGNYSRSFKVAKGENLKLNLRGFYAYYGYNFKDESEMINFESVFDIEDAQINLVNLSTGAVTPIEGAVTDEDGVVTLNFSEEGTYVITASFGDPEEDPESQVLSLTSVEVVEPAEPVNALVTISSEGNPVLVKESVKAKDHNLNGVIDVDDVLYTAHEEFYPGGAEAGYAAGIAYWGDKAIMKLWGIENGGAYGFYINNNSCWSLDDSVEKNDSLVAYSFVDASGYSDIYSYFESDGYGAAKGESASVSLWADYPIYGPKSGATLTVCDKDLNEIPEDKYTVTDNNDGTYDVKIEENGNFLVVATDENPSLVPAITEISVMDPVVPAAVAEDILDYEGSEVYWPTKDLDGAFGMLAPQDGSEFKVVDDKIVMHFVPSGRTVYGGLHWGAITDTLTEDIQFHKDGCFDLVLDKKYLGKMIPVAPVKKTGGTTSKQYYLAIPSQETTVTLKAKTATYTGKAIAIDPATVVGSTGEVTYAYYTDAKCTKAVKSAVNAGTYYVTASVAADEYFDAATSAPVKLTIQKSANKMTVKAKKLKASAKKTKSFKKAKAFTIKNAAGTVTFKQLTKNKKIKVNSKSGKVTVKKGLKKGKTYKIKVKVTAKGNANYKAISKKVVLKVKVGK